MTTMVNCAHKDHNGKNYLNDKSYLKLTSSVYSFAYFHVLLLMFHTGQPSWQLIYHLLQLVVGICGKQVANDMKHHR